MQTCSCGACFGKVLVFRSVCASLSGHALSAKVRLVCPSGLQGNLHLSTWHLALCYTSRRQMGCYSSSAVMSTSAGSISGDIYHHLRWWFNMGTCLKFFNPDWIEKDTLKPTFHWKPCVNVPVLIFNAYVSENLGDLRKGRRFRSISYSHPAIVSRHVPFARVQPGMVCHLLYTTATMTASYCY